MSMNRGSGSVPPELIEPMLQAVDQWVGSYSKRVKRVDPEDMRQQAIADCVYAARKYQPGKGAPGPYFGRCAKRAIFNYLIKVQAPISGSARAGRIALIAATSGKRSYDAAMANVGTSEGTRSTRLATEIEGARLSAGTHWTEALLEDKKARVAILSRILQLVPEEGRFFVRSVIFDEVPKPKDPDYGEWIASRRVARKAILADERMREMLHDRR